MLPLSENALDELVARERERGAPPLTEWGALAGRLRAEGLIRDAVPARRFAKRYWRQAAAALLLASGGLAAGRVSAGAPLLPSATAETAVQSASEGSASSPAGSYSSVRPDAGSSLTSSSGQEFRTPEDAWVVLNRAGEEYQRASAYLSASNVDVPMPQSPSIYRTRLAALDNVMSDMRDALREAPQDPVINQYYLATVGAREATLRQLGTTLPAGARLNQF